MGFSFHPAGSVKRSEECGNESRAINPNGSPPHIAMFCNEVKGKSALAISRDMGLSYKSAFVLLYKLREAMPGKVKRPR